MRLVDLSPHWVTQMDANGSHWEDKVSRQQDAQGVRILCPKCFTENGGPVGTHSVIVLFKDRDIPPEAMPLMARWEVSGNDFNDLTTTPSILINGGCGWHGFITNGDVT